MAQSENVLIARIGRPHGLRGEVTVQAHTDDPQGRFAPGTVFDTQATPGSGVPRALTLRTARLHREIWLLGFDEIPDRTGAESLRGTQLLGPADEVDDDEGYYEDDLVGLTAFGPSGQALGEVTALTVGAAQDLLTLRLADGREALIPFVEAIVPLVDIEGGRIVIDPPAGLLDLAQ
ncbi:MAG: ribosome maturation factor RimM [Phycicoccus sp.]|nr:ribosome maturation factor RimM [Phycicoccus sp.]